jgi:hypothetical protein
MYYFIFFGILAALAAKRDPRSLIEVRIKARSLLFACLLVQIVLAIVAATTSAKYPIILHATFIGAIVFLLMNVRLRGSRWIITGTVMNAAAMLVYGGMMPVARWALEFADMANLTEYSSRHQLLESHASPLSWLGDWIPFVTPLGPNFILSPGDILIGIGLIVFIFSYSRKMSFRSAAL